MYGLLLLLMIRSLKKSLKLWISPPTTCWSLTWKQTDLKDFLLNICFLICCLNTATTQFNQTRKKTSTPKIESNWGPLYLSPVDRAGPLTGTNFGLGSYENSNCVNFLTADKHRISQVLVQCSDNRFHPSPPRA